jgi:hypothetical protein
MRGKRGAGGRLMTFMHRCKLNPRTSKDFLRSKRPGSKCSNWSKPAAVKRAVKLGYESLSYTALDLCGAMLTFLREDVPKNWTSYRDTVTDNFRVISPKDFRVVA